MGFLLLFGLGSWAIALWGGFRVAAEKITRIHDRTVSQAWASVEFPRDWRAYAYSPADRLGDIIEAGLWLALGVGFFAVGSFILAVRISLPNIVGYAVGPALTGLGFWLLRRWRNHWRTWAGGGHRNAVLLHLVGSVCSLIAGISILAAAL